jgi:ferritin-like metal-binding protein YciE
MAKAAKNAATKKAGNGTRPKQAPQEREASSDPLLKELFVDSIKDIYWAEKKLLVALPKMQKASTTVELKNAIGQHIDVTRKQVTRLEQVFELLEERAQGKKCEAMEGLIKEGESIVEDTDAGTATRDVGIIMASQKVEHYEIATYGSLVQLAKTLGLEEISGILSETLAEEKEADETLTEIAESNVNYASAQEGEEIEA